MIRMRRIVSPALLTALFLLIGVPGLTAQEGTGDLAWVIYVSPQAGHVTAFEEGARRHAETMAESGVTMTWIAMEIALGPRTGQYMYGAFSLSGADLDAPQGDQEAMQESFAENIDPHTAGAEAQILRRNTDLGMWTPEAPLAPMYQVFRMWVKPGGDGVMRNMFSKIKGAMEEMNPESAYSVWQPVAGGMGSEWAVTVPVEDFTVFDENNPTWMEQLLAQAYGHDEMQLLMESMAKVVVKSTDELFVVRPDMSVNLPEM